MSVWSEFLNFRRSNFDNPGIKSNNYGTKLISVPETLNSIHENPFVGTNGTAQWGLNAIFMLELIGDKIPEIEN